LGIIHEKEKRGNSADVKTSEKKTEQQKGGEERDRESAEWVRRGGAI